MSNSQTVPKEQRQNKNRRRTIPDLTNIRNTAEENNQDTDYEAMYHKTNQELIAAPGAPVQKSTDHYYYHQRPSNPPIPKPPEPSISTTNTNNTTIIIQDKNRVIFKILSKITEDMGKAHHHTTFLKNHIDKGTTPRGP